MKLLVSSLHLLRESVSSAEIVRERLLVRRDRSLGEQKSQEENREEEDVPGMVASDAGLQGCREAGVWQEGKGKCALLPALPKQKEQKVPGCEQRKTRNFPELLMNP
ncbi:hypothetical protein CRG98_050041 [Punica granatum]|uniref:Uncharacterized protein n=1 Tax=Punica granatum TaxID=22663 RepID=A0A2I0GTC4_PUNGR|nr:hypothetical protein CRG98_050041 [Punica granatum]